MAMLLMQRLALCEHYVMGMLLSLDLMLEAILTEKKKKKKSEGIGSESNLLKQLGNKIFMGKNPWF
jgi:hypothetical protein